MNLRKLIVIWFLAVTAISMQAQQAFTLEEAIDYALQNHNNIKQQALNESDAEMQVKEYWARGLPTVNGNVGYQYFFEIPTSIIPAGAFGPGSEAMAVQFGTEHNLTAGLTANALLFDGGFLVGLQAQRAYKKLVESQIGQTERDIRVNVINAYLNSIILNESIDILSQNISNISDTRDETQQLYENGFAEQLDVDRLDLTIQNLNTEKENLEQLILSTKAILKFQMGYPLEEPITLTNNVNEIRALQSAESAPADDWTFERRVEVGLLDQAIGLTDINVRALKAQYLPSLTTSINYNQALLTNELFGSDNKWYPTGVIGLNLAVPIFDAGDKKAKIARANIQRDGLYLQRDDLRRAIELEVQTARISLENASRTMDNRKKSQDLAEKIYSTTLVKYKEGVGSSLEVNSAKQEMLTAQGNYIDSLFNYLLARTEFERAIGNI